METAGLGMNYNKKGNVDSCVLVIRLLVAVWLCTLHSYVRDGGHSEKGNHLQISVCRLSKGASDLPAVVLGI